MPPVKVETEAYIRKALFAGCKITQIEVACVLVCSHVRERLNKKCGPVTEKVLTLLTPRG